MASEVKIVDARKVPAQEAGRVGKVDRMILYALNGGMVHFIRLPDEGFTEEKLRAAIQADMKEHGALVGKTFSL